MIKTVFAPGMCEPGMDNYECPLRSIIADLEKEGGSADVTRHELSLGDRDPETGWRKKNYAKTTIKTVIRPRGHGIYQLGAGGLAKYENTGFIPDCIAEGDLIEDDYAKYYEIKAKEEEMWLNLFSHHVCNLVKLSNYPEVSVYVPSASEEDARYRTRVWLGMHLSLRANWASMFAFPNYPLQLEFTGDNAEDVLFCVGQPNTTPLFTYDYRVYAFREQDPITIAVLQKYSQDDTEKMLWAAENALRTLCRNAPATTATGQTRTLNVIRDRTERFGNVTVAMRECTINYKRTSEYKPTYPTITLGPSASPTGTFIFPNVINIRKKGSVKDFWPEVPSYSGSEAQGMGSGPFEVTFVCDLDVSPTGKTWKRPQTADAFNAQVIFDIWHNEGIDQDYHTLVLSTNGPSIKVRIVDEPTIEETGDGHFLTVTFREQREDSASDLTLAQRLGIS